MDKEHVRELLKEGAERLGVDAAPTEEQLSVALEAMQSIQGTKPSELVEQAASTMESTWDEMRGNTEVAEEAIGQVKNVTAGMVPHLMKFANVDESRAQRMASVLESMSAKMVQTLTEENDEEAEAPEQDDEANEFVTGAQNEFCRRVFMLLFKLALYARPVDELPTFEEEPEETTATFEAYVNRLSNGDMSPLEEDGFQEAYMDRVHHVDESKREPAEHQALLWWSHIYCGDAAAQEQGMRRWHDAIKDYYATLNAKVPTQVADVALREAVPKVYPLHASELLVFWDEEEFSASRNQVLADFEQINLLSGVLCGIPPSMRRMMAKFSKSSDLAATIQASSDGNIDPGSLMEAALKTVQSLDGRDTRALMRAIPEMLRGAHGPLSGIMQTGSAGALKSMAGAMLQQQASSGSGIGQLAASMLGAHSGASSSGAAHDIGDVSPDDTFA